MNTQEFIVFIIGLIGGAVSGYLIGVVGAPMEDWRMMLGMGIVVTAALLIFCYR